MKSLLYFFGILLFFTACQPQTTEEHAKQVMQDIKEIPLTYEESNGKIELTRNFYFIFDQSGSMGESCSNQRKIDGAKQAITKFMQGVPSDVNIALMSIGCTNNGEICEWLPLSIANDSYKEKFNDYIMDMEPSQGTPLVSAIKIAVDRIVEQKKKQLGYGDYRIIVITDGQATDGDIEDAATYAIQYTIGIYTIGLCIDSSHPLYQYSVMYYDADDYTKLQKALESVTAETEMFDASIYDSTAYQTQ